MYIFIYKSSSGTYRGRKRAKVVPKTALLLGCPKSAVILQQRLFLKVRIFNRKPSYIASSILIQCNCAKNNESQRPYFAEVRYKNRSMCVT